MQNNSEQNRGGTSFPQMEGEVSSFWESNRIFEKSVDGEAPKGDYVFYDGPPFATGTPHYGHITGSIMKDVVPRYFTMRGFRVERKWGWDCHGLPIENIVEKELGSKKKKDIEAIGVAKFNELCRANVLSYVSEWEKVVRKLGRWADMKNAYKTMDVDYMESIWWVFKNMYDKGLIYEGHRPMHVCPRCETTLSQSEVAEGYKDVKDLSCVAKFRLTSPSPFQGDLSAAQRAGGRGEVFVLAWTTTPWTLIGNVALAINKDVIYCLVRKQEAPEDMFVVAKERVEDVFKGVVVEIVKEVKGEELVGLSYKPVFEYYLNTNEELLKTIRVESGKVDVAVMAIYNKKGEVLLGHRNYSKDNPVVGKDFWISPSGKIETGETFEQGLERELQEECNITDFKIRKFLGSHPGYSENHTLWCYLLEVDDIDQIKNNEPDKFAEWKFFPINEMPVSDFPNKEEDAKFFLEAVQWHNAYKIYHGDFVTTEDGTGVVHIAPAFGADDMALGKQYNLPFVQHVSIDGVIKSEATDFAGMNVKPIDNHSQTDIEIIKNLAHRGLLFSKEKFEHSYPHCWRCDTPLINYATSSWFVSVEKNKELMLETAKKINWSPAHIKEGRFGNWLSGARDWSISRQRFWASVMPMWKCSSYNSQLETRNRAEDDVKQNGGCGHIKVIGSIDEIKEQFGNPNRLFLVRHGQSENNVAKIVSSDINNNHYHLTELGKRQVQKTADILMDKKIDYLYCSPMLRTKETAEIIAAKLGLEIIFDDRLVEYGFGKFDGKKTAELHATLTDWPATGDALRKEYGVELEEDAKSRFQGFLDEINEKHQNKNIVVVSHGDSLQFIYSLLQKIERAEIYANDWVPQNAAIKTIYSKHVDLHKHVVDEIVLPCEKCGGEMHRIPDVLDTWFDSGSMPYAQMHYPFENQEKFEKNYPAEFIAEGQDQCRAWFYYLHVIGNNIRGSHAFKNVIVNGIVLAEDGKKMSKKLKNYPDPMLLLEKYGADALRIYLLSSPAMQADNINFSEKGVLEALQKNVMILWNIVKFYELFAESHNAQRIAHNESENVLDKWILARLNQLIVEATKQMESYDLPRAVRPITEFINDLSTWYVRRSRDRFKSDDEDDKASALATTKYVLIELSKIMAPFAPFIAEQVWQKVSGFDFEDADKSVHLEGWPVSQDSNLETDNSIIGEMETVRRIVEMGLSKRDEVKIKIRQPLSKLRVMSCELREDYVELLKDELNVKEVETIAGNGDLAVELDTEITHDLKLEGIKRELVRFINNMRKDADLSLDDRTEIFYETDSEIVREAIEKFVGELMSDTLSEAVHFGVGDIGARKDVKIEGEAVALGLRRR